MAHEVFYQTRKTVCDHIISIMTDFELVKHCFESLINLLNRDLRRKRRKKIIQAYIVNKHQYMAEILSYRWDAWRKSQ